MAERDQDYYNNQDVKFPIEVTDFINIEHEKSAKELEAERIIRIEKAAQNGSMSAFGSSREKIFAMMDDIRKQQESLFKSHLEIESNLTKNFDADLDDEDDPDKVENTTDDKFEAAFEAQQLKMQRLRDGMAQLNASVREINSLTSKHGKPDNPGWLDENTTVSCSASAYSS